jgi:hypothetical protein
MGSSRVSRIVAGRSVIRNMHLMTPFQALHDRCAYARVQVQTGKNNRVTPHPLQGGIQLAVGKGIEALLVNDRLAL